MPRIFPTLVLSTLLAAPFSAQAQNLAPELMVGGSCEDKVAWASRSPEVLIQELDEMIGTDVPEMLKGDFARQALPIIENTPVSDSWFPGTCDFSAEQIAAMAPLHEAYVAHFKAKMGLD
jgi:hypothetical protein